MVRIFLIFINPKIKIIHLWRNDLEARYYSQIILKYKANLKKTTEETLQIKHKCSSELCFFSEAVRLINWGNLIVDIFRNNQIFNLSYEDFISNAQTRLKFYRFFMC